VAIHTDFDHGPKLIQGDAARLQQVIWNVLSNAVKFTPVEGTIRVRVSESDGRVTITVSDTGRGISPEFLPYIFDRFRQANSSTSRVEGGLGLGLALVRQLVDLHGGDVRAASLGEDQGTTFTITLPSVEVALVTEPEREPPPDRQMLSAQRILVVDDDADWRDALKAGLELRGAQVDAVGTAGEAIDRLHKSDLRPTAIVLDIGLPEEDGYALIQKIRRLEGDVALTPAVAVTAYAGTEHERRALSCGFDAFRIKPITVEAVAVAVLNVTDSTTRRE
jgi:CheY-like chemotaxis protein